MLIMWLLFLVFIHPLLDINGPLQEDPKFLEAEAMHLSFSVSSAHDTGYHDREFNRKRCKSSNQDILKLMKLSENFQYYSYRCNDANRC